MDGGGFADGFSFNIDIIARNDVSEVTCGHPTDGDTECPGTKIMNFEFKTRNFVSKSHKKRGILYSKRWICQTTSGIARFVRKKS